MNAAQLLNTWKWNLEQAEISESVGEFRDMKRFLRNATRLEALMRV